MRKHFFSFLLLAAGLLMSTSAWAEGHSTQQSGDVAKMTVNGTTAYYATLSEAIADANLTSGATITLLTNVDEQNATTTSIHADRGYVTGDLTYTYAITSSMTIDGATFSVTNTNAAGSNHALFGVRGANGNIDVEFKDINMTSKMNSVIETLGNIGTLTLTDATLVATACGGSAIASSQYGNPHGLRVDGYQTTKANIILTRTSIDATNNGAKNGYGTKFYNPVHLVINGGSIRGYCSLYFKPVMGVTSGSETYGSEGSDATVTSCTFKNVTNLGGSSNDFGSIVLEDDGITVNLTNCDVTADGKGTAEQHVFLASSAAARTTLDSKLIIDGTDTKIQKALFSDHWYNGHAKITAKAGIFFDISDNDVAEGYLIINNPDASTKEVYPHKVVPIVATNDKGELAYSTITSKISEAEDDVYLDMSFWNLYQKTGAVDEEGNPCPHYVSTTDETLYRDPAITAGEKEDWVSAKYIFNNYMADGKRYNSYQTSYLYKVSGYGPKSYATLADAIADAKNPCTVTLKADCTEDITLPVGCTFVTTGYTYTGTVSAPDAQHKVVNNDGVYTVVAPEEVPGTIYAGDGTAIELKTVADLRTYRATKPNSILIVDENYKEAFGDEPNVVVKYDNDGTPSYVCPNFVLQDKGIDMKVRDFYTPVAFTATKGTYTRSLTSNYNTCCVPFALKDVASIDNAGYKILTYQGYKIENGVKIAVFNDHTIDEMNSQQACLIYSSAAATLTATFDNTPIVDNATNPTTGALTGPFVQTTDYATKDNVYSLVTGGACFGKKAASVVYSFRCVLDLNGQTPMGDQAPARASLINLIDPNNGDGLSTELDEATLQSVDQPIYTTDGRLVGKSVPATGLYIVNGKVQFIRK